jgi:hypothetical protein
MTNVFLQIPQNILKQQCYIKALRKGVNYNINPTTRSWNATAGQVTGELQQRRRRRMVAVERRGLVL